MTTNENTSVARSSSLGGKAYLALGILLVAACLRAAITAVGPLIGDIRLSTGLSNTLVGMLTTLPLIAFAILSPLAPRVARRYGIEAILLASLIALTVGIIVRSLPTAAALFVGTAVLGSAIAFGNVLLPGLIKRDFSHRVGVMTGAYSVSMNGWAALASGVSVPLAHGLGFGWQGALGCWALLSLIALVLWVPQAFAKRRANAGQSAVGASSGGLWRSRLAWQVTLFMGLQSLGFYVSITWLPEVLHDRGLTIAQAGWLLSLMQFVSLPTTFAVPVLAGRRASQRGLAVIITLLCLIGYTGLLSSRGALVPLWIVLLGLGQGGSISLALTLFALRSRNAQQAAELSGMAQSLGYLLAAVGPTLLGYLHDATRDWTIPIVILIAVTVIQLFAGLGAGRNAYVSSGSGA